MEEKYEVEQVCIEVENRNDPSVVRGPREGWGYAEKPGCWHRRAERMAGGMLTDT